MENRTQYSPLELDKYMHDRDEIGKLIIHDLVGPLHNLLTLSREFRSTLTNIENLQSADIVVQITEQLLNNVYSLYTLAFDNKKLFVISIFDVRGLIEKLIKTHDIKSRTVSFEAGIDSCYIVGDEEVTRIWISLVIQMLQQRFGQKQLVISLSSEKEHIVISMNMKGIIHRAERPEAFVDNVIIINKLTQLLDASIAMVETESSVNVTLRMISK